jgi:hypothetical protein
MKTRFEEVVADVRHLPVDEQDYIADLVVAFLHARQELPVF